MPPLRREAIYAMISDCFRGLKKAPGGWRVLHPPGVSRKTVTILQAMTPGPALESAGLDDGDETRNYHPPMSIQ